MTGPIDNTDDVIDSRDIIARIEDLKSEREALSDNVEACKEAYTYHDGDDTKSTPEWEDLQNAEKELAEWEEENAEELRNLENLAEQCEGYGDWEHGEMLIHRGHFVAYIEELINDCYEMPKEMNSGNWPYRHMTMDYEAAAEEAEQDYMSVDFDGQEYLMHA